MVDAVPVLVVGAGRMGCGISRLVLEKAGLELVGVCDTDPRLAGRRVCELIGSSTNAGVSVEPHLDVAIRHGRPRVAIQASCSSLEQAWPDIATLLRSGVNVISIAEEMVYPACVSASVARELRRLAERNAASVLGTGVNPGFVLDLLVIALTGVCSHVEAITARRCNDLAPFGPAVLAAQGVGLTPEAFARGVAEGSVTGHVGFEQSMHMVAGALGWTLDGVEQHREPIISRVRRRTEYVTVEPGQVAGCLHTAVARRDGRAVITLVHPQQVHPALEGEETGDCIEIVGRPTVRLAGSPEIPGGEATTAIAVNMIPRVLDAPPGLHTMIDLPVPAALPDGVYPGSESQRLQNRG